MNARVYLKIVVDGLFPEESGEVGQVGQFGNCDSLVLVDLHAPEDHLLYLSR